MCPIEVGEDRFVNGKSKQSVDCLVMGAYIRERPIWEGEDFLGDLTYPRISEPNKGFGALTVDTGRRSTESSFRSVIENVSLSNHSVIYILGICDKLTLVVLLVDLNL